MEFDLDAELWLVLASRMQGGGAYAVHLSPRAVAIVKGA